MVWKTYRCGTYEVASNGSIRRAKATVGSSIGKILKPALHKKSGYFCVTLCLVEGNKRLGVHQVVAEAFLGPCPKGKEVNHKDLNKANNKIRNLEYLTRRKNILHAVANGHWVDNRGEKSGSAKLSWQKVNKIRAKYNLGYSPKKLAARYGVGLTTLWNVLQNKTWVV